MRYVFLRIIMIMFFPLAFIFVSVDEVRADPVFCGWNCAGNNYADMTNMTGCRVAETWKCNNEPRITTTTVEGRVTTTCVPYDWSYTCPCNYLGCMTYDKRGNCTACNSNGGESPCSPVGRYVPNTGCISSSVCSYISGIKPNTGGWSACMMSGGSYKQYLIGDPIWSTRSGTSCSDTVAPVRSCTPPLPTLDLSASPTSLSYLGGESTITWSTTNVTSCLASGDGWSVAGPKGVSGNEKPSFPANNTKNPISKTFTMECRNSANVSSGARSVTVTVLPPPLPTLNLSISSVMVSNMGDSSVITWTSDKASKCLANGSWNGEKNYNGTFSESKIIDAFKTFNMRCENVAGDYVNRSVSACYRTNCAKDTCIGTKCQECSSTGPIMVDGTKDCRDENWQEVSPN